MTDDRGAAAHCPFCGHAAPVLWVHGHGQCAHCGVNREPCCDGAPLPVPTDAPGEAASPAPARDDQTSCRTR